MKKQIVITSVLSIFSAYSVADIITAPQMGRATGNAWVSNNTAVFGGDIMQPMLGNDNGFVYGDINGDGATNSSWLASPGLGFRNLSDNVIYGMYAYGDYQQTNIGGHLWVVNPGVEIMTPRWDAHVNAYIAPDRTAINGTRAFGDTFGIQEGALPTGNQFDDVQVTPVAVFGSGLDSDLGYSFPYKNNLRARVSLGGYYYRVPSEVLDANNVLGITGGLRLALSPSISVAVNDSYDSIFNNIASLSFSYSFGSEDNDNLYSDDVHDRLLAPNIRHVGIQDTGAGQMAQQGYGNIGSEEAQLSDVFYFDPSLPGVSSSSSSQIAGAGLGAIGIGSCTAQNPCGNASLNQANINALAASVSNAKFFLSTGTFDLTGNLTFHEGQEIYGRDAGFATAATGSNRPLLDDGIILDGGNNIIDSIQVSGSSPVSPFGALALYLDPAAAGTVTVNKSVLTSAVSSGSTPPYTLIQNSSASLTINDSSLFAEKSGSNTSFAVVNILNQSGSPVFVNNSTLSATNTSVDPSLIVNFTGNNGTIENSSFSADGAAIGDAAYGFSSNGTMNVFRNSTMTLMAPTVAKVTGGGTITYDNSTCTLNGVTAAC